MEAQQTVKTVEINSRAARTSLKRGVNEIQNWLLNRVILEGVESEDKDENEEEDDFRGIV